MSNQCDALLPRLDGKPRRRRWCLASPALEHDFVCEVWSPDPSAQDPALPVPVHGEGTSGSMTILAAAPKSTPIR